MTNIMITLLLLTAIITLEVYILVKNKHNSENIILKIKFTKFIKIMYLMSLIITIVTFILEFSKNNMTISKNLITNIVSILIITFPLSLRNLYNIFFQNKHFEYTKTIVTNKLYDTETIKKLNRAGINIIILTDKKTKISFRTVGEKDLENTSLNQNLIIKTKNISILNNKEDYYYDFKDDNSYEEISNFRGKHDNFIRTIKFNISVTLILGLSYIIMNVYGFPLAYNIPTALLLKLFVEIINYFVYPQLPYDTDIMTRKVKPKNILIGKEELFLCIIQSSLVIFALTIPFMLLLINNATIKLVNTIYLIGIVYGILFLTIMNLSEKMFIINFIKCFTNIRTIFLTLVVILLSLTFYYVPLFNTKAISLQNYTSTIIIVLISVLLFDITKLARYTTTKGIKKHGSKNN